MNQLLSILLTDWILPNSERDTPARHTVRIVVLLTVGSILWKLS